MTYNATVTEYLEGERWGTFLAQGREINGRFQMLRSNKVQCTGYEGKTFSCDSVSCDGYERGDWQKGDAVYDWYLRRTSPECEFSIAVDGGKGYKNLISGLALPPAYRPA